MISRRLARIGATALFLPLVVGDGHAVAADHAKPAHHGAPGVGDPYWPLDGNGGIDVAAYKINNSYNLSTFHLSGTTTLRLRTTAKLDRFDLDFLLPVSSVTIDGAKADFSQKRKHELVITPASPLAQGSRHRVTVTYAGNPKNKAYAGEKNWLADAHEVVAMNQPHMAPWWFPANDHPIDKARFDISTTVAVGREVIGNGTLVSKKRTGRQTTWRWRAKEPMSSYLAFFAAGDFTIKKGTSHGLPWVNAVSHELSVREQKQALTLLRRTPGVVRALAGDLGPYPFSVTGGLTTGLPVYFALENQTRPTYPFVGSGDTSLIVHELAHQWLGDDVAIARWRDIWLNEGAATFMEWRYAEQHDGRSADDSLHATYDKFGASSRFWELSVADPGPAHVFDSPIYERGGMTLQALRNRIGEEKFWLLLRTWLAEKSRGNGTSEEFEALAEKVSGQELSDFFDVWLRTGVKPAATTANGLS